jgi:hypothetical protein
MNAGRLRNPEGVVGEDIDYSTRNGLHRLLRGDIEREAVRIF